MARSLRQVVFAVCLMVHVSTIASAQAPYAGPQGLPPPQQPEPFPPIYVPPVDPGPLPPNNNPFVPPTPTFVDDPFRPVISPTPTLGTPPGCYGSLEISLLFPDLYGWLSGPVTVKGIPDTVALGSACLDGTGSPRLELGYRLGGEMGAVAVVYRSIVSQGATNISGWDILGDGFLNTRLNVNVVDIDYASPAYNVAPFWDFAWRAGLRGAAAYYDNLVIGNFVRQQATNNFLGAGPHATLEVGRALDLIPGLAVVSRVDGAILFGNVSQSFTETVTFPWGPVFGDTTRFNHGQTVPVFTFDLGLSYTPATAHWARFGFGYRFEYWWDVGTAGNSRGDLGINGLFFRGEFNF